MQSQLQGKSKIAARKSDISYDSVVALQQPSSSMYAAW
jgi:hypothetical protein